MEVLPRDEVERVEVPRRRVAGLGTRDVEADDPLVAVPHRQLGDLDRARRLAHGGDDEPDRDRAALRAPPEPGEHGERRLVEGQAAIGEELGCHPHLGIDDAVGRQVLRALGRDALDRVAGLHDRQRVAEALEVELERLAVCAAREPRRQLVRIGRRQVAVAGLRRQLEHRARPEPTVEVVVEQHLRRAAGEVELKAHRFGPSYPLSPTSAMLPIPTLAPATCWNGAVAASFISKRDGGAAAA